MTPTIGNLVRIKRGTHIYTSSWKLGSLPPRCEKPELGIILDIDEEKSIGSRAFWLVATRLGIGWMNSDFCHPV
jgi:hypothetical protein